MRKILTGALALIMALGLAACAKGGDNDAPPLYGTFHVAAMAEAGAFSEALEELDADTAFLLYKLADYGLERETLKEATVCRSAGATCEELAVLIFDSEDSASSARDALEAYVQNQIDENTDYRPQEIPKLKSARINQREETVLFVVANDMEAAKDAVE